MCSATAATSLFRNRAASSRRRSRPSSSRAFTPTSSLALQQQRPVPPPATPPIADGRQFEGQLVINVGPFTDMATLGTFEQALAQLPQTEDVSVEIDRFFEVGHAITSVEKLLYHALLLARACR